MRISWNPLVWQDRGVGENNCLIVRVLTGKSTNCIEIDSVVFL